MRIRRELIAEYAAKHSLPFDDLIVTSTVIEKMGIKTDYNNYEDKLIRMYHWLQWVKAIENNR